MKFKEMVCSFELSERLEKLGIRQESYFYWCKSTKLILNYLPPDDKATTYCSAFTLSEVLKRLPDEISEMVDGIRFTWFLNIAKIGEQYIAEYQKNTKPFGVCGTELQSNPANACASLLVKVIERGFIK